MDWFKTGKGVCQGCILSPYLFNICAEDITLNSGLNDSQAGIKIVKTNNNNLWYADDTILMSENKELKSLLMKVKEESENGGLKLNTQKTKIIASSTITSWQINGGKMETVTDFIFLGYKINADGECSHKIKRWLLLGRKAMTNLHSILKTRDITLPTKVCIVKVMVFLVVYTRMWELDHKEGWAPKNWCFQTAVWEKTLESPLDSKEIKPVNPKGNQSWIFIGRTDADAEAPVLWSPDAKSQLVGKDPDAGKDWRQKKGVAKDVTVRWHHWLNGHEFGQTPGDSEGQGSLACCSSWGCCRKGDPFQGPKLGSCLMLGNELSEETHLLTKQETLLGKDGEQ